MSGAPCSGTVDVAGVAAAKEPPGLRPKPGDSVRLVGVTLLAA